MFELLVWPAKYKCRFEQIASPLHFLVQNPVSVSETIKLATPRAISAYIPERFPPNLGSRLSCYKVPLIYVYCNI